MSQLFSGIPFAPQLYFLVLLAMVVTGVLLCLKNRFRSKGVLVLCVAALLIYSEYRFSSVDLNPTVKKDELVGNWHDWKNSLTLKENGEYILVWAGKEYVGTWNNDDYRLLLYPSHENVHFYPRIVKVGSQYRIATNYQDIDTWDGDLGFWR